MSLQKLLICFFITSSSWSGYLIREWWWLMVYLCMSCIKFLYYTYKQFDKVDKGWFTKTKQIITCLTCIGNDFQWKKQIEKKITCGNVIKYLSNKYLRVLVFLYTLLFFVYYYFALCGYDVLLPWLVSTSSLLQVNCFPVL